MKRKGRKLSAGTLMMVLLTIAVLIGSALFAIRFSSGSLTDVKKTPVSARDTTVTGQKNVRRDDGESVVTTGPGQPDGNDTAAPADEQPGNPSVRSFTLTIAGTVAVEGEVRKNCYVSEVKTYDFSDIMSLLQSELHADLNIVFFENVLSGNGKISDTAAPDQAAELLKAAGIHIAACGFSKAWAAEDTGIVHTREVLSSYGITPVGIYAPNDGSGINILMRNGVRIAVLQYTDSINETTRKKMTRKDQTMTVPPADADLISSNIAEARSLGAEAVIVLISWDKVGKKQKTLAQQAADAGADLIIGCGTRTPLETETLHTVLPDGSSREVICVWSLGTVLSGEQKNIRNRSGYLLHVRIETDGSGYASVAEPAYTPLYTWRYKQDGRVYYRCLAANRPVPDGMDSDQQKSMEKAAATVQGAMENHLLTER